ncbi:MAG: hypothetical protein JNL39_13560 [Opitutaceae bacterium]|nr:hypothetical protein [Opitutaceae bacterium]
MPLTDEAMPDASAVSADTTRRTGRWGEIEVTPFWLEPPDLAASQFSVPDQRPVWRLPGENRASVTALLQRAGLGPEVIAAFLAPGTFFEEQGGIAILPSLAQLYAMGLPARQVIYERLGQLPGNPYHEFPLMSAAATTSWLAGLELSAEQRHAFVKLLWRRGALLAFSDPSALVQLASSSREIAEVTRLFGRTSAVRIRVGRGSDAAAFLDYWSAGGRNREALPLLRSLAEGRLDGAVDISLLLPPLCRERLYTHPALGDAIGGQLPDCNWTTLSFFAATPRRFLMDPKAAGLQFEQNYENIPALSALGDVACFVNHSGGIEHSCVHIVDDVVFTKNGVSPLAPWVLQRFVETAAFYGERLGNTVKFFRPKATPPGR